VVPVKVADIFCLLGALFFGFILEPTSFTSWICVPFGGVKSKSFFEIEESLRIFEKVIESVSSFCLL